MDEPMAPARTPGKAIDAMEEGLRSHSENKRIEIRRGEEAVRPRCWPSTLLPVDRKMGGFYGFSSITGFPGLGKSMVAISSGLSAAADGWQVVHFFAENDLDDISERVNIYLDTHPEVISTVERNYYPHAVGFGQTPRSLFDTVRNTIDWMSDLPVLVVIDSANSVVNMNKQTKYLEGLKDIGMWAMASKRLSCGAASFLITSEANKTGAARGEGIPFWADVDLRLARVEGSKRLVRFEMPKTRRFEGMELGVFMRDWGRGEFLVQEEIEERKAQRTRKPGKVIDIASLRAGA